MYPAPRLYLHTHLNTLHGTYKYRTMYDQPNEFLLKTLKLKYIYANMAPATVEEHMTMQNNFLVKT